MRYSNNHQIYLVLEEIIIFDKKKYKKRNMIDNALFHVHK